MRVLNIFGTHPLYQTFYKYPPKGVIYVKKLRNTPISYHYKKEFLRRLLRKTQQILNIPRVTPILRSDVDLIHTSRGIIPLTKLPYVMDIEFFYSFTSHNILLAHKPTFQKNLYFFLKQKNCKKILAHSKAALNNIKNCFPYYSLLKEKFDILYPSIQPSKLKKQKHNQITLLFIANAFYAKGGLEVLESYKLLRKKYDIKLIVSCPTTPLHFKRKFNEVEFLDIIESRDEFFRKTFLRSDIFIFPTFIDTFGYVLLEAMSFKLPIVATKHFTIPEIVKNNYNGFLIEPKTSFFNKNFLARFKTPKQKAKFRYLVMKKDKKMIHNLTQKLTILIENTTLRKKMGKNGYKEVTKGKFSVKQRNKKLKSIYDEALNG